MGSQEGAQATLPSQNDTTSANPSNTQDNLPSVFGVEQNSNQNQESQNDAISFEELKYGFASYFAISTPVSITMILSALAVTYIQSQSTQGQEVSSFYTVFDVSNSENTNAQNFGYSLVNGLIIISVIAAATFFIVLLYKYRCMKLLVGYMIFSSAALLGLLGGVMFQTFIERYGVVIDQITFYFLLVNFAAVGTISIFYGKGIPSYITQMYLIFTSSILAWQLSFFNDWTAWMLLVLLALYDLCAVLTPCGPLKFLVNLMQKEGSPEMPGLLYEARLPQGVDRPGRGGNATRQNNQNSNERRQSANDNGASNEVPNSSNNNATENRDDKRTDSSMSNPPTTSSRQEEDDSNRMQEHPPTMAESRQFTSRMTSSFQSNTNHGVDDRNYPSEQPSVTLPFAIVKIYKLQVAREGCPQFVLDKYRPRDSAAVKPQYTPSELRTEVTVHFPVNGGRILVDNPDSGASAGPRWNSRDGSVLPRYIVLDRNNEIKRVLVMNEEGKVFEEMRGEQEATSSAPMSNTIKLGLGDFIFYSVLVAKAALNSFTTFAACMLVILFGLGGTLVLLSVYHSALPALPISIFLGVIFFFTTRALLEPWVAEILSFPCYV